MSSGWGAAGDGGGMSIETSSPPLSRCAGFTCRPSTETCPCSTSVWMRERVSSGRAAARCWSTRCPRASGGTRYTLMAESSTLREALPDLRLHLGHRFHHDVHHRSVEEVGGGEDLRADAALVELPALFQLVLEHLEQIVLLDALD